ncbi:MAG: hypothetical protein JW927_20885 [Deltaproteobacteria bacterium]|nr:hypothetical protein [Deltaproteobacteria bacterium]
MAKKIQIYNPVITELRKKPARPVVSKIVNNIMNEDIKVKLHNGLKESGIGFLLSGTYIIFR